MKYIIYNKQGTFEFSVILKDCSGKSIDDNIIPAKLFCGNMCEKCGWKVQEKMQGFGGVGVL